MRFLIIIITILTFNTTSIAFDVSEWWGGVERICQTWGRFVNQYPSPAPCSVELTGNDVRHIMPIPTYQPDHIWDKRYKTTSVKELKRFLEWDLLNENPYRVDDYYDCDDKAIILVARLKEWTHGLCVGLLVKENHMKVFFIDEEFTVYEIEPKNDEIDPLYSEVLEYFI